MLAAVQRFETVATSAFPAKRDTTRPLDRIVLVWPTEPGACIPVQDGNQDIAIGYDLINV